MPSVAATLHSRKAAKDVRLPPRHQLPPLTVAHAIIDAFSGPAHPALRRPARHHCRLRHHAGRHRLQRRPRSHGQRPGAGGRHHAATHHPPPRPPPPPRGPAPAPVASVWLSSCSPLLTRRPYSILTFTLLSRSIF